VELRCTSVGERLAYLVRSWDDLFYWLNSLSGINLVNACITLRTMTIMLLFLGVWHHMSCVYVRLYHVVVYLLKSIRIGRWRLLLIYFSMCLTCTSVWSLGISLILLRIWLALVIWVNWSYWGTRWVCLTLFNVNHSGFRGLRFTNLIRGCTWNAFWNIYLNFKLWNIYNRMINEARLADHLSLLLTLFSRVVTFITDALVK
jgi:hypothetical protein